MAHDLLSFGRHLFERLATSEIQATYQDAFRAATGLPLLLVDSNPHAWCVGSGSSQRSPFCQKLALCLNACRGCIETNRLLMERAAVAGPTSCHCFAGMAATAVPVRAGDVLVGFLKTGQVFTNVPEPQLFEEIAGTLSGQGLRSEEISALRQAYFQTQSIEPERYQSMVILLTAFAEQLGKHAEKLLAEEGGDGHEAVARAKRHIELHMSQPLPLPEVANVSGLSTSQFCRVFKQTTGLSLVDYVNRRRVEAAKRLLLKPGARISEVAFQTSYQSISQFNRCFRQLTGRTPSRYRQEELAALAA